MVAVDIAIKTIIDTIIKITIIRTKTVIIITKIKDVIFVKDLIVATKQTSSHNIKLLLNLTTTLIWLTST